jgi:hypothetical protein
MFVVRANPISYTVVQKSPDNQGDLTVCNNFFVNEVVQAGMFELAHDSGGDVSCHQYWDFRWGALLDRGHRSLVGRHCMMESERMGNKGEFLGTGPVDTYGDVASNRGRR